MPTDTKLYGKKRKKRRFSGNQFRNKKKNVLDSSPHEESDHTDTDSEKENIGAKPDRLFESVTPTRSEKKLFNIYNLPSDSSDSEKDTDFEPSDSEEEGEEDGDVVTDEVLEGYRLIDVDILAKNISTQLSCKSCGQDVTLLELSRKGLASEFVFHCVNKRCDNQTPFPSSPIIQVGNLKVSSVNRRACFAMRCTGGGRAELQTFCGVMALPPPVLKSSNHIIQKTVMKAATAVQDTSMRKAAEAEYALAEVTDTGIRDIDASLDGTYMTRGHTSLIGVTTAIGCVTGKVLDTGVLSKICKSCEYWSKQDHTTER